MLNFTKKEADIVAEASERNWCSNHCKPTWQVEVPILNYKEMSKSKGGLAIIGTERHDSRRVDRQLRGRSRRQGDPGSSQFYVSLEDNLMRLSVLKELPE